MTEQTSHHWSPPTPVMAIRKPSKIPNGVWLPNKGANARRCPDPAIDQDIVELSVDPTQDHQLVEIEGRKPAIVGFGAWIGPRIPGFSGPKYPFD